MSNEEFTSFLKKNVVAVACVVASIAIGLTVYLRSDLLPEAEKVFTDNAQKAALLAANIEDSEQLKDQHTALSGANQKISGRMIRVGQLGENQQFFYRLESDTGAKLTDLRQVPWNPPVKGTPKTVFVPVGFAMTAQGTYAQLMDLLRRLEGGEHFCRVLTCNIHPVTELRGGAIQMALSLELLGTQ